MINLRCRSQRSGRWTRTAVGKPGRWPGPASAVELANYEISPSSRAVVGGCRDPAFRAGSGYRPRGPVHATVLHPVELVRALHRPRRLRTQGAERVGRDDHVGGGRRQGHGRGARARRTLFPVLHLRRQAHQAVGGQGPVHRRGAQRPFRPRRQRVGDRLGGSHRPEVLADRRTAADARQAEGRRRQHVAGRVQQAECRRLRSTGERLRLRRLQQPARRRVHAAGQVRADLRRPEGHRRR